MYDFLQNFSTKITYYIFRNCIWISKQSLKLELMLFFSSQYLDTLLSRTFQFLTFNKKLLDMTAHRNPHLSGRVIRLNIKRRIVSRPTLDSSKINFKTVSHFFWQFVTLFLLTFLNKSLLLNRLINTIITTWFCGYYNTCYKTCVNTGKKIKKKKPFRCFYV